MSEDRWKRLDVWKLADELAYKTYLITRKFPKEELYGPTSQLRRSALSVPTNIVEGYSRKGDKELAHFVNISLGSMPPSIPAFQLPSIPAPITTTREVKDRLTKIKVYGI